MFFKPEYILILAFTIFVDYYAGILIENSKTVQKRKFFLTLSLIANIGVLAIFKYYNFINDNITGLSHYLGFKIDIPYLHILLPIGLSFHTFQAMSYTIEVYKGDFKAEKHFGMYALYVMFYPQLVAGPIERPQNILHQLHEKKKYNYAFVVSGLRLMLWGFFKKIVVADRLGLIVDEVYKNHTLYKGQSLIIGAVFFAFQIYADFSGYSDIALGSAKVMGYDLMPNFNYPFKSKTVTEYWRRWHISLSSWFNDYLFTPILISKRNWGKLSVVFGLMFVFFISGLWHGASWTFIVWGLLHGGAMCYEFLTRKIRKNISKAAPVFFYNTLSQLLTFSFLILTWIFFRSENFGKAFYIIKNMFAFDNSYKTLLSPQLMYHFMLGIAAILLLEFFQKRFGNKTFSQYMESQSKYARWFHYIIISMLIINFGYFGNKQFIYFQF